MIWAKEQNYKSAGHAESQGPPCTRCTPGTPRHSGDAEGGIRQKGRHVQGPLQNLLRINVSQEETNEKKTGMGVHLDTRPTPHPTSKIATHVY
jgi:hypothetical protein